jgi:hypothetical protein
MSRSYTIPWIGPKSGWRFTPRSTRKIPIASTKHLAEVFGISTRTARRWLEEGKIVGFKTCDGWWVYKMEKVK